MISTARYEIAQSAEKQSHIIKKDMNILDKRIEDSKKFILPYLNMIEEKINTAEPTMLDIGSGPTCVGRFFKGTHKFYLDPLMEFYKSYYPAQLPTDGTLVQTGGEKLDHADETFDAVISNNMLDHTFNPIQIASEIRRTLKKGGYLMLGIYTHSAIIKAIRVLAEASWIFKERPHPYSYTINDVKKMFQEGFEIEKLDLIKGDEKIFNFRRRYYLLILRKTS